MLEPNKIIVLKGVPHDFNIEASSISSDVRSVPQVSSKQVCFVEFSTVEQAINFTQTHKNYLAIKNHRFFFEYYREQQDWKCFCGLSNFSSRKFCFACKRERIIEMDGENDGKSDVSLVPNPILILLNVPSRATAVDIFEYFSSLSQVIYAFRNGFAFLVCKSVAV